jgi:hypothetical protein
MRRRKNRRFDIFQSYELMVRGNLDFIRQLQGRFANRPCGCVTSVIKTTTVVIFEQCSVISEFLKKQTEV